MIKMENEYIKNLTDHVFDRYILETDDCNIIARFTSNKASDKILTVKEVNGRDAISEFLKTDVFVIGPRFSSQAAANTYMSKYLTNVKEYDQSNPFGFMTFLHDLENKTAKLKYDTTTGLISSKNVIYNNETIEVYKGDFKTRATINVTINERYTSQILPEVAMNMLGQNNNRNIVCVYLDEECLKTNYSDLFNSDKYGDYSNTKILICANTLYTSKSYAFVSLKGKPFAVANHISKHDHRILLNRINRMHTDIAYGWRNHVNNKNKIPF